MLDFGGAYHFMIERLVTVTISVSSILLFCYWFRYVCRLTLSAATSEDYATNVAQAYQLCFPEAQLRLSHGATELDWLKEMLDRDYAVVAPLVNRNQDAQGGTERRMLLVHYRLTSVWYRVTRHISAKAARRALEEMSLVVAFFANSIGEASASAA
jgi:hypothetical protein